MKIFLKQHLAVVLALLLPVIFLVVLVATIYLPAFFVSTEYDFVYATCTYNSGYHGICGNYVQKRYEVSDGTLTVHPIDSLPELPDINRDGIPARPEDFDVHFFRHDTEENISQEIDLEEAQVLSLDKRVTSPDGATIIDSYSGGNRIFFPFFINDRSSYGQYLSRGGSRRQLNVITPGDQGYYAGWDTFFFMGWVIEE